MSSRLGRDEKQREERDRERKKRERRTNEPLESSIGPGWAVPDLAVLATCRLAALQLNAQYEACTAQNAPARRLPPVTACPSPSRVEQDGSSCTSQVAASSARLQRPAVQYTAASLCCTVERVGQSVMQLLQEWRNKLKRSEDERRVSQPALS